MFALLCSGNGMAPKTILAKMHYVFILWCLAACAAEECRPERCGSINVSFPFWIKNPRCGYRGFKLNCRANVNNGEDTLFLPTPVGDFEILNVNYSGYITINSTSLKAVSCNNTDDALVTFSLPPEGPFLISAYNRFAVIGCGSTGSFIISSRSSRSSKSSRSPKGFLRKKSRVAGGCESSCRWQSDPDYCNGYPCCEVGNLGNLKSLNFTGGGLGTSCGFSTILQPATFKRQINESGVFGRGRYGLLLKWGVGQDNCSAATGTSNYVCAEQAKCNDSLTGEGHVCTCRDGYIGNGYSEGTGCTDADECSHPNECVDTRNGGICQNLPGSYNCSCQKGYIGNGFRNRTGCPDARRNGFPIGTDCMDVDECSPGNENICVEWTKGGKCQNLQGSYTCSCREGYIGNGFRNGTGCRSSNNVVVPAIIGSVSSFVGVSLAACGLFWCLKRRHMKYVRAKYFQQNGGIQLQQYITSRGGRGTLKIYSATELEKASKNYSPDMKLGSGGYGSVFKAVLPDGTVGAIKKAKDASDPQPEDDQFVNELVILSQINHRNIVKLVGCCLETQNPLLVYEFVSNGTLRQHIDSKENLVWETRLRVAIEAAEALAYLHSAASQPIFHRDVKSANILLDKTYTPKVADFGISRLLNVDETHHNTNLAGTVGYMDPEYFQSFQLTDKSDVYSFGVVLLELLTGLQPFSLERPPDEYALSGLFLSRLNTDRLHEILDGSIMNAENSMEMKNMASLARECLHVEGRRRPSMKDVAEELIWIRNGSRRRKPYPSDEKYGNEMGMQSDTAEIEKGKWASGGEGAGESASQRSSVALNSSFSMDGR